MTNKEFGKTLAKREVFKSVILFCLHFAIFVGLVALSLWLREKWTRGGTETMQASNYLYAFFCGLLLFVITYFYFYFENPALLASGKMIALVFTILDVYLVLSCFIGYKFSVYARPVALVALLVLVLCGRREAIFMNIVSALLIFIIDTFAVSEISAKECYSSLIISFTAGMIAIFLGRICRTRLRVILIGIVIVFPILFVIFLLQVPEFASKESTSGLSVFQGTGIKMGYGLFGGVMSAVLFLFLLPIFENVFNCLTDFRLRELTSSDARILKKLKSEAPGTYNHSMMVAQLAEASAAAIGENVDYARAAAMYHDVGKIHYPEHFTENQGDYNLHDELTPELSADIIRSHAKDGYTLIRNYHLPEFLADVALEHHGTMPIRYFYAKALKMTDGELNIEDFSYMGPKPQTKIAAIVMIADASEAAVRATGTKDPLVAEKAIRSVIEERMDLEQFAECDITMADLTKIRLALVNTLTGVYHHRIKYPDIKYRRTESGMKGENQ